MKPLSAKAMPTVLKPLKTKARIKQLRDMRLRVLKFLPTGFAENAHYDPTDIATDAEAAEKKCDCIIHSGGHKPFQKVGYMTYWAAWEEN